MADPVKITDFKDLSPAGQEILDIYNNAVEKAAVIKGTRTGILAGADIERVIISMAGVKGISGGYPESVATLPIGKDAKEAKDATFQEIEIKGIKKGDFTQLVKGLKDMDMTITEKFDEKTGVGTVVMKSSEMQEKLVPKMKDAFEKLGTENPELIRSLQRQSADILREQKIAPSGIPLFKSPAEIAEAQAPKGKAPADAKKTVEEVLNALNPNIGAMDSEKSLDRVKERKRSPNFQYVATAVGEFTPAQKDAIITAVIKAGGENVEFQKDRFGKATILEIEVKPDKLDLDKLHKALGTEANKKLFEKVDSVDIKPGMPSLSKNAIRGLEGIVGIEVAVLDALNASPPTQSGKGVTPKQVG